MQQWQPIESKENVYTNTDFKSHRIDLGHHRRQWTRVKRHLLLIKSEIYKTAKMNQAGIRIAW